MSPAEREKYRPRSPVEIEEAKRRKEDKLTNVSNVYKMLPVFLNVWKEIRDTLP